MAHIFNAIGRGLSRLIGVRALLVAITLFLALMPVKPQLAQDIEAYSLSQFERLYRAYGEATKSELAIVSVLLSAEETEQLLYRPAEAEALAHLALQLPAATPVVVQLPKAPRWQSSAAQKQLDQLLLATMTESPDLAADSVNVSGRDSVFAAASVRQDWLQGKQRRQLLELWLASPQVLPSLDGYYGLKSGASIDLAEPQYPNWWPEFWRKNPVAASSQNLLRLQAGVWQPSLLVQLEQRLSGAESISWSKGGLLTLDKNYPLSELATLYPKPSETLITNLSNVTGESFKGLLAAADVVLIATDTAVLQTLSTGLMAVHSADYLYTPWWYSGLWAALLLLLLIYLLWIPACIRKVRSLLSTLVLLVALVAGQVISAWFFNYWLPLELLALLLLLGYLLMLSWRSKRGQLLALTERLERTSLELSKTQLEAKSWPAMVNSAAKLVFKNNKRKQQYLSYLYQAAEACRDEQRFSLARDLLTQIRQRKRKYKDVAELLKTLPEHSVDSATGGQGMTVELDVSDGVSEPEKPQAPATEHLVNDDASLVLAQTVALPQVSKVPKVLGRYEIERELGRGSMGIVYLGRDPKIARQVAIKTMNFSNFSKAELPALRERFFREAEAAGRLRHPNIVTVYDVGDEDELAFIAMDYIEGKTLAHYCRADTLLPVKIVYEIVLVVAEALGYAHGKKIIHRDIKPENILFNAASGQVSVSDFGIARISDESRTKTGSVLGSPLYMAPEQLRGKPVNAAADIFSLGVTLYQLLTGGLPFHGDNLAHLTYEIINNKHKPVRSARPELPPSASRIVNKALQKDPAKRYSSADEFAQALRSSLNRDFKTSKK